MPEDRLTAEELAALVERVFRPSPSDRALAILVDLPDETVLDNPAWRSRRLVAAEWARHLRGIPGGREVGLFCYRNVHSNNADLPATGWRLETDRMPDHVRELEGSQPVELAGVLAAHPMVMAPTEMSATAPLKVLAPRLGFRAATMPRFSAAMIPALRIDYTEVDRRVRLLTSLLDAAVGADLGFVVDGHSLHALHLDLRHRTGHASGGLLRQPGTAGNLPSGEAYIVPYEGELEGDPSRSSGELPIQLDDQVVVYRIENNHAAGLVSSGARSAAERDRLEREPAAGNIAELGLGVLAELGIEPIGEVLLDEKLGLHIAFGRSEHFGGQVGPAQFSSPDAVIHQDHVFLPQLQPRVVATTTTVTLDDGSTVELIRDGRYAFDFRG